MRHAADEAERRRRRARRCRARGRPARGLGPIPIAAFLIAAIALATGLSAAVAQAEFEVLGTVDATIDGEPGTWYALGYDAGDGEEDATVHYQLLFGSMFSLQIQAHVEPRYQLEGTLALQGSSFAGVPSDCPCTLSEPEASYWSTSAMLEDVYMVDRDAPDAEVILDAFEPIGDDAYRAEGSFRVVVHRYASVMGPPDLDDTLVLEGTFSVDRVPYLDVDLGYE
ncbi:MAG: hypothetical protein WD336_05295 [Trueperaceae bacterium]